MSDFKEQLKAKADHINKSLDEFFEKKKEKAKGNPAAEKLLDLCYDYTMRGGKRMRPAAMLVIYENEKGEIDDTITAAALAVELIQNSSICHDDVIDEDVMRRGKETVHVMAADFYLDKKAINGTVDRYRKGKGWLDKSGLIDLFISYKGLAGFGRSYGILGGDILLAYAFECPHIYNLPDKERSIISSTTLELYEQLVYGETADVGGTLFKTTTNEESYLAMIDGKTGALFTYPVGLACDLAGVSRGDKEKLVNWAKYIFRAFQIQDDIMGSFGEEEKVGKPIDSDIREGKETLLLIKARENASEDQLKTINKVMGNRLASKADIEIIKDIMQSTGALDYNKKRAKEIAEQSLKYLNGTSIKPETKEFLTDFTNFVVKRDY